MSDTPAQDVSTQPQVDSQVDDTASSDMPSVSNPTTAIVFPDHPTNDVTMSDAPGADQEPSLNSTAPVSTSNAASPAPAVTSTPSRTANGIQEPNSSRAGSAHPDPGFTLPEKAAEHGDPVRKYLNNHVTGVLLDGMKKIAKEQPKDPLRQLGEYLIEQSKAIEKTD